MPPAVPAAITAAATLGGGIIASKSSKNAAKTQAKSTSEALAYEKQKDAEEAAYRAKQDAMAQAAYEAKERIAAPYRQASSGLLASEMARLGLGGSGGRVSAAPASGGSRTLAQLAGTGTVQSAPLDPYNTEEEETARDLKLPQFTLEDIIEGMKQGRIQ